MPSKFKIIKMPSGQAPADIREQWVGVEMPLSKDQREGFQAGVLGGPANPDNRNGYKVSFGDAVKALETAERHEAANWWKATGIPESSSLVFGKDFCELVE